MLAILSTNEQFVTMVTFSLFRDLIRKLLVQDRSKRLGSMKVSRIFVPLDIVMHCNLNERYP